jgi:hypothetical protein
VTVSEDGLELDVGAIALLQGVSTLTETDLLFV